MAGERHFDLAVSLGPGCRTKHQLLRVFGEESCPSAVFDWQITPPRALRHYLRDRFAGRFALDELSLNADGYVGARDGVLHMHSFPRHASPDAIRAGYEEAHARHEYLARKTLHLLRGRSRLLLVLGAPLPRRAYLRLWMLIRWNFPWLRFTLLNGPEGDLPATAEDWQGDDAVWDRHLAPFRPTGQAAGGAA